MSTDYNPFQSPETPMQPNAIGGAWPIVPFESGHQRAVITIALLAAIALIGVAGLVIACTQYTSLEQQLDGTYTLSREGAALENGRGSLAIVELLVILGLVIAFSMWTHRAARNLPALGGRKLQYTPGWAVGWFFIPFANLVMPYFVAAEIWRESDPEQRHLDGHGGKTTSPLVLCWWLAYITRSVVPAVVMVALVVQVAIKFAARHGTPEQLAAAINGELLPMRLLMMMTAGGMCVVAAILAIMYVRRVDTNQLAKYELGPSQGFAG